MVKERVCACWVLAGREGCWLACHALKQGWCVYFWHSVCTSQVALEVQGVYYQASPGLEFHGPENMAVPFTIQVGAGCMPQVQE